MYRSGHASIPGTACTIRKVAPKFFAKPAAQRINSMLPNAPTIEIRCDVPVVAMRRLVMEAAARERGEPITARAQAPRPIEAGAVSG